ncbi:hypothetical protein THMIRHAM_12450 [Thiomicrorhabdus immobilis]|uniref:DUF2202 domain-containing protein n=1 Tax=Thiomicrorhabdus immobilis TaxID=2791037 RepID=A0ABM7MDK4_9GAMM|nr:DUF2202 domain-containing protein [Thiomicrorhabdus immobilis]BCN93460.1 hypothetical protein THMIRHAM_12450 [Thiomicrorhabdus immobilis]
MKNSIFKTALVTFAILAVSSPYAVAGKWNQQSSTSTDTQTATTSSLTSFESDSLKFMREEEKLARDVYLSLYDVWGMPIFQNIADSEQKHTDSVASLLTKYGIEDPVKSDAIGEYTDPAFTELYHALVDYGSYSYEQALKVGTEIEELDIADLNNQLNIVKKSDIQNVYSNLLKGSRNHLRSFYSLVVDGGFEYTPTHISQEEFDAIVYSESETGNINDTTSTSTSTTSGGKGRR